MTRAAPLLTLRQRLHSTEIIGVVIALAGCAAIGFLPLFDGPGYEYALASGLFLPALVAIATALRNASTEEPYIRSLERGIYFGLSVAAAALLVAFAHGLRVGLCDAKGGSWLFALGPGCGCVLAGTWGALVGVLCRPVEGKKRVVSAIFLGFAAPLLCVAVSVWRFYSSPMIFAFDPFVGFFAGALYDTVISGLDRLQSYRVGSFGTLLAVIGLVRQMRTPESDQFLPRWQPLRLRNALLLAVGGVLSVAVTVRGPALGHYQTEGSIVESLGGLRQGQRCEVVYSRELATRDVALLARECDAHVKEIEDYLGTRGPAKIRVFLFDSPEQKSWLMGAATTYIAKPWREEIYLQAAGFPHPVLAHELAHVIAGTLGRGPFKVAGTWGGLLPDPGRIEGIAVAAAPSDDADLTAIEWSRAMLDLDLLPPLQSLFGLGFLGQHSSAAYTVAGAFLQFLRDQVGAPAVGRWYSGETLEQITGQSLGQWEARFRSYLSTVRISDAALQRAKALFNRPSVFARRCP
ncbi:MAG TPA: hypothetical protein VL137_17855, partial [Polyangiaceae bacterium]|nr:hypothetical protein [Polyangiaceae bacterium]